jgi:hypothetical protein
MGSPGRHVGLRSAYRGAFRGQTFSGQFRMDKLMIATNTDLVSLSTSDLLHIYAESTTAQSCPRNRCSGRSILASQRGRRFSSCVHGPSASALAKGSRIWRGGLRTQN